LRSEQIARTKSLLGGLRGWGPMRRNP
jgi:hypothetical protein